ncbi:MAG: universal stress protein [Hydrogenophilus thermoluteolus]|uniref:universal stress protein n=1 Tax=Hydrogenophilus thermoluteolus TaxID=297 RepID=UPI0024A56503|nr:universal stress protein [Hydrogenophilus thermoluteolus]GLW60737.1 universal stress protein UspA [Hydrogenophilus thermoluteolus]HNQ48010.1 universal stress protein [Hydrogenophilus thermoluteolus]HNU19732.1 universal stress protein [Hydrogenophilus thermoluteolus]
MFRHLLVPTDGSELALAAVERAVAFAKALNARITFFYAQPDFPLPVYGEGALIDPTTPEQFRKAAQEEANTILNSAKEKASEAGVEADTDTVVSDAPADAIIDAAERHGCDLIFIASHGRSGIARLLLGSVTNKVLSHTKLPVLVYR